ncbi:aromatic amino acid aminotransferase [Paenibacillus chitinolyticus]|uniref:Aminotransferase n=1 Tax=Paenibacillus chitinolyticus TaxID=79263 RepID=A0A410X0W7_9BACL|nr:aminotransferase A [Paenibacillus chitinolyticus]MCY9588578.1 aminotransferase A [Paenibacillus chitinolyticus]MCY9597948.1 aminotransferase A [Paenibacillus chitinolyticus]QAV20324.1 aromatic amino acid aminotransferase [Paenibacillus chitinolyticus]
MQPIINPQVKEIQISGIRKIANKVAAMPDALALTMGQPDFPTPAHIVEAAQKALQAGRTVYTPNAGLPELRKAAADFVGSKYGLSYDGGSEVIVTTGASEALDITLRTILTPGAEVILPGPIYPGYEPLIRLCGGVPVYVDTRPYEFKMTAAAMEPHLTERTRCVVLGYPSNPTGQIMTKAELAELAALLGSRNLYVISDEIYSELVYGAEHASIAAMPGMREKTIVINGLSKSHSMTGWRIGFTFAPEALTQHMVKVHQYNVTCASSISQYAAVEALTAGRDDALPMRQAYENRLEHVYGRLQAMGLEAVKPQGAFYLFPSIARFGLGSEQFAYRLLEEQRVAVVPGDAFSPLGEGYIRLSYAYSQEVLDGALDRLEAFIRKLDRS